MNIVKLILYLRVTNEQMTPRNITLDIFGISGFSILAGNAFTYRMRSDYEPIAVSIGLLLCIAARFLVKKQKRKPRLF